MKEHLPAWLVIAHLCDCGKVALTIFDRAHLDENADLSEDTGGIAAMGTDWRTIYAEPMLAMAEHTGLPISICCSSIFADDAKQIEEEIVYLLQDLRGGAKQ